MSAGRQVSVAELKRAWRAVQAGEFGQEQAYAAQPGLVAPLRSAGGRVIPVLGCGGGVGASTTALALALASGVPCRLIECASSVASGLAGASTAELGVRGSWRRGTREDVLIERTTHPAIMPADVPAPAPADRDWAATVVDLAWPLEALLARPTWLRELTLTAEAFVLVTSATMPGLRRLEAVLAVLAEQRGAGDAVAVVAGLGLSRWPKPVRHSMGPRTRQLEQAGRVVALPRDRHLAIAGVDTTPLPPPVLAAATAVLHLLPRDTSTSPAWKGSTP